MTCSRSQSAVIGLKLVSLRFAHDHRDLSPIHSFKLVVIFTTTHLLDPILIGDPERRQIICV